MFGMIPIGGGENCQTAEASDIRLQSAEGEFFDPNAGGTISGEYSLSEITDCGPLTGILSLFTAGDGNTIDLTLAPKA
ncbi:hypothetical protein BJF79_48620 [Actinomadura sp. CNU-125]|nr:hypothetical protein BJF79_48620 [Actinomadura sp. CNU-125]